MYWFCDVFFFFTYKTAKSVSTWEPKPRVVNGYASALWEVLTELMECDCRRSHVGQGSNGRDQLGFISDHHPTRWGLKYWVQ